LFKPRGTGKVHFRDEVILLEKKKLKLNFLELFGLLIVLVAGIMLILRVLGVIG